VPSDVIARIRARGHIGIRLGLERMRALLGRLDDPQASLRGVLVGGTNGKGSTAAMAAAMLQAAGYTTARSPSPHLLSYRERVTVDEQPIGAADLDVLLREVLRASEAGEAEHGPATEFELFTAASYLWSARQGVDVVVMEVGLGGRLDASNSWDPDVAAITNVSLDHEAFLGHTVAAVAAEKAAIIKLGGRAVTGARGEALTVITERARSVDVPLRVCPRLPIERMDLDGLVLREPRLGQLRLPLLGRHQAGNAAVSLGIVAALDEAGVAHVPDQAVAAGLARVRWPGRLERIAVGEAREMTVLLDGAHNPDGATALAAALDELAPQLPNGAATLLLGILADKDAAMILGALAASRIVRDARCVTTRVPDTDRSLPADELAAAWGESLGRPPDAAIDDVDRALDRALDLAAGSGGLLIVTGSLYLVGHVRGRIVPGSVDA
jgi:dihydrofolate synthase/folylpolyglutamate synthase